MSVDSTGSPGPNDIICETPRLVLRYQRESDIGPLVDLWTDPVATQYMGGPRDRIKMVEEFTKVAINPRAETYDLWPAIEKQSGRLAGYFGLIPKNVEGRDEVELIYMLVPRFWGQGHAFEMATKVKTHAFTVLGLNRLVALIDPQNAASEKLARKLGMTLAAEIVRPDGRVKKVYAIEYQDAGR